MLQLIISLMTVLLVVPSTSAEPVKQRDGWVVINSRRAVGGSGEGGEYGPCDLGERVRGSKSGRHHDSG
jgi:hypothetical protein